jgi:hypothetical protein
MTGKVNIQQNDGSMWTVCYEWEGSLTLTMLSNGIFSALRAFSNADMVTAYQWSNGAGASMMVHRPKGYHGAMLVKVPEEIVEAVRKCHS